MRTTLVIQLRFLRNNMPEPEQIFETTATDVDGVWYHFGIIKSMSQLWGKKESEVEEIKFKIHPDQERNHPKGRQTNKVDYFGWWDNRVNKFTLIYPAYFLLDMCFPHGIKGSEEDNQGKAYRLLIIQN